MEEASAGGHERLRVGRARLTVARSGPLDAGDRLSETLDAYERGEARASSVARAYLRARIVDHSPSFSWRTAKITELIPLVTAISADPKIEAASSKELADELVRLRRAGHSRRKAAPKQAAEAASAAAPVVPGREPAPATAPEKRPGVAPRRPPAPPPPRPLRPAPAYGRRRAIALAAAAGLLVLGGWLLFRGDEAAEEADAYRLRAGPAVSEIADSMDGVYGAFDVLLGGADRAVLERTTAQARATIEEQRLALEAGELDGGGETAAELRSAVDASSGYVAAATKLLARLKGLTAQGRDALLAEAPAIYATTRRLAERADRLEDQVMSLGSGDGDPAGANHYRPAPPAGLRHR